MKTFLNGLMMAASLSVYMATTALAQGPIPDEVKETTRYRVTFVDFAVRDPFNELDKNDRMRIQLLLQDMDLYTAGIDGSYGPGTENALEEIAWVIAQDRQERIWLSTNRDARKFLSDLLEMSPELPEEISSPAPAAVATQGGTGYFGSWNCGHVRYDFSEGSYRIVNTYNGSQTAAGVLRIDGVQNGFYFADLQGYGHVTFNIQGSGLVVDDMTDGSTASCRRI